MLNTIMKMLSIIRGRSTVGSDDVLLQMVDVKHYRNRTQWNVRQADFSLLYEQFGCVAMRAHDVADTIAERVVELGGSADARSQSVSAGSSLSEYSLSASDARQHVELIPGTLAKAGNSACEAIDQTGRWNDPVTVDSPTDVSRLLDKPLWLVEAHATHQARIA